MNCPYCNITTSGEHEVKCPLSSGEMKHAKDEKCCRCKKPAVVFVGLADPDATKFPMCEACEIKWKYEIYSYKP